MQIKSFSANVHRLADYTLSQAAINKIAAAQHKILGYWERLKAYGLLDAEIVRVTGISRATFYRWKAALKISADRFSALRFELKKSPHYIQ